MGDAIDRRIGEDLPDEAGTIAGAVVLEADHRRVVETIAGTKEVVEATREAVLPEDAMTIVTGVATKIIGLVTTTTSVVVPRRCTAETIAAETIAVIVVRKKTNAAQEILSWVRNLSGNKAKTINVCARNQDLDEGLF